MKIAIRVLAGLGVVFFAGPAIYFATIGDLEGCFTNIVSVMIVALGWSWYEEKHNG